MTVPHPMLMMPQPPERPTHVLIVLFTPKSLLLLLLQFIKSNLYTTKNQLATPPETADGAAAAAGAQKQKHNVEIAAGLFILFD